MPEKNSNQYFLPILTVLIIVAAIAILYVSFAQSAYRYSTEHDGVIFYSNDFPAADHIASARAETKFIISPAVYESGTTNQYMVQSLTMLTVVLTKNSKDLVTVARVYDSKGTEIYCHTNDGNAHVDRQITLEECSQILSGNDSTKILISIPNPDLKKSEIILEEKKITINPMNYRDVSFAPLVLLRAMYQDIDQTISTINDFMQQIKK